MEIGKNRNLMTVKEFAKLCNVTPRTLKYYEEMGIFFPHTVQNNGYRLYDVTQADDLSCILLFREYGFSLKEIRELMSRHDLDAIWERLQLQKEIISQKKQELLMQEQMVDDTLKHLQKARECPDTVIEEIHTPQNIILNPFETEEIHHLVQNYLLDGYRSGVYYSVDSLRMLGTYQTLSEGGLHLEGPGLCCYHRGIPSDGSACLHKLKENAQNRAFPANIIFCEAVLEDSNPQNCLFRYFMAAGI